MSEQIYDYDPVDALNSAEAIEVFMTDALDDLAQQPWTQFQALIRAS